MEEMEEIRGEERRDELVVGVVRDWVGNSNLESRKLSDFELCLEISGRSCFLQ